MKTTWTAALLALGVISGQAAFDLDPVSGTGKVDKGDVQGALRWSNGMLQANAGSLDFAYREVILYRMHLQWGPLDNLQFAEYAVVWTWTKHFNYQPVVVGRNVVEFQFPGRWHWTWTDPFVGVPGFDLERDSQSEGFQWTADVLEFLDTDWLINGVEL